MNLFHDASRVQPVHLSRTLQQPLVAWLGDGLLLLPAAVLMEHSAGALCQ